MEFTDAAAVARMREGDPEAFRVLVDRHARSVFRLAYRMTGNQHDAEDMVQETFLRAYKQLHRFDGRASFSTWLYRISANCSLDFIRARKKRQDRTDSVGQDPAREPLLERYPASDPSPERLAHSSEVSRMLGPALDTLSEMERTAFVLRHYEGLSIEEIGRALGVQPNAAKHTVFRAVQKLRLALKPAMSVSR